MGKAFRNRHTLEDAVDKQVDSFIVKLIRNVAKFLNFALKTVFDGCSLMLPKALAKLGAEIGEMASERSVVMPSTLLECSQRRWGRFLEGFVQPLSGLVYIEVGPLPNADSPPIGHAEHIDGLNRTRFYFSGQEVCKRHVQRTRDSKIGRKQGQLSPDPPFDHGRRADPEHATNAGETLDVSRGPDEIG